MKNFGFVKVAAAVPLIEVGNPVYNCEQIANLAREASDKGASLVVFPMLAITGASCGDLFWNQTLLKNANEQLLLLAKKSKDWRCIAVVGTPILWKSKLYSAAAIIGGGTIHGISVDASHEDSELPLSRWFSKVDFSDEKVISIGEVDIPIGKDIIYKIEDMTFSVEFGEGSESFSIQKEFKADILCQVAASSALMGKCESLKEMVKYRSKAFSCGYIFVSAGITESTTDFLCSGDMLICENGELLEKGSQKEFENKLMTADIDIEQIRAKRSRANGICQVSDEKTLKVCDSIQSIDLQREINPMPFVPEKGEKAEERMEEVLTIQSLSLGRRLRHTGLSKLILGISGGLDSTLALLVSLRAIKILDKNPADIIAVTMPGFGTTKNTLQNAKRLMDKLNVDSREISIAKSCELHLNEIGHDMGKKDVTYENAQARERTQILLDLANQEGGLMVGTGDLSEMALGFTTYNGDHMSMYGVNAGVPKTLIRFLVAHEAKKYGGEVASILEGILQTPISPELLPPDEEGKMAQKTEKLLGDYLLHDFFLYYFIKFGFSFSKILFLAKNAFAGKYTEEEIFKSLEVFANRFFSQQFKRSCVPDGPKALDISLSPRGGWNMPSDCASSIWIDELEK